MTHTPTARINFLNSLAFGVITPPVYYMIALPFSMWIALLFVIDIAGRFIGQLTGDLLQKKLGERFTLTFSQAANAIAYSLLIVVGVLRPTPAMGFLLIYLSRVISATASASLPSVRPTNSDRFGNSGILTAQFGFAIGCVLTALLANHNPVKDSILVTGGLLIPAIAATAISAISTVTAWFAPVQPAGHSQTDSPASIPPQSSRSRSAIGIMLACESAFAMILCVAPLTDREVLEFSPATLGYFFAALALISAAVAWWTSRQPRMLPPALNLGLFLSAAGFIGFAFALWLSWKYPGSPGIPRAMRAMWAAGMPAAIGHGLLRAALPWTRRIAIGDRPEKAKSLRLDGALAVAAVGSVLFASNIWVAHERPSLAIPGVILLIAMFPAVPMLFSPRDRLT